MAKETKQKPGLKTRLDEVVGSCCVSRREDEKLFFMECMEEKPVNYGVISTNRLSMDVMPGTTSD